MVVKLAHDFWGVNSLSRDVFFSHFVAALSPVARDHFLGDNWVNYQGKRG